MVDHSKKKARLFYSSSISRQRLDVIDAAIESICRDGIENLTFDSVAKVMGKRPSHIKYHFNQKSELIHATFRRTVGLMQDNIIKAIDPVENPKKALETYVIASMSYLEKTPKSWPLITLFLHYCSRDKELRELNKRFRETAVQRITAMLEGLGTIPVREHKLLGYQIFMLVHVQGLEFIFDQSPGSIARARERIVKRLHTLIQSRG